MPGLPSLGPSVMDQLQRGVAIISAAHRPYMNRALCSVCVYVQPSDVPAL